VALPKAGSFQDAVLQEALFREQNLKYTELSLVMRGFHRLIETIMVGPLDRNSLEKALNTLEEEFKQYLRVYEIELFQDRYSPSEIRKEKERKRQEDAKFKQTLIDQEQLLDKVKGFTS